MGLIRKMYNKNKLYKNQYDSRWWCKPWGMIHHFLSKRIERIKNNKIVKLVFQLISQIFYSNFEQEYSLDAEFNSSSKEYPCCILLMNSSTWKMRNTSKTWLLSHFSCISHFACSRVHPKYTTWVLLGWGIKFCIQ